MTVVRTAAIAVTAGFLLSVAFAGCGDEKEPTDGEVHKAKPTKQIKHDRRPEARGRGAKIPGKELFTAKIELVQGKVALHERHGAPLRSARVGSTVFGGGEISTGENALVKVAVREVGVLTLDANSTLVIPRYSECGAILVAGTALLDGSRRVPARQRCFLYTASAAVWSPRNRSVIAIAPGGATAFAAIEGASKHTDLLGAPVDLAAGKQLVFDRSGKAGEETAVALGDGPLEQGLRPWLTVNAAGPKTKGMLDDASRIAKRLELDVERLAELMALNRAASEGRKTLDADDADQAEKLAKLTADLTEQATEMTDLQVKGILQINRIIGILEVVRQGTGDQDKARKRIAELEQKLALLAEKLPPLFERKRKTRVTAGQQIRLDPVGPPPKPPK